jgi:hypothetical protein
MYWQLAQEVKFHPDCFSCSACHTHLAPGDVFTLVNSVELRWFVAIEICVSGIFLSE